MPITSHHPFSLTTLQFVDVDCSAVADATHPSQELASLFQWIRGTPKRSSIHVRLRFATGTTAGRKLKGAFQALGCTVSMKSTF